MKKIALLVVLFSILTGKVQGQVTDPVKWTFSAKKKNANTYEVVISAVFAKPWHLYSSSTPDGGPLPTTITFKTNPLLTLKGKLKEIGAQKTYYDQNFKVDVKYFLEKADFVQTVKVKGSAKVNITGNVEYMVCDDKECLPPTTKSFSVKLE